ncbi:hypothetical protein VCR15J2_390114 [Vibrio coralliirubri]|nr:hypothetical protein VCR15J2_390114 [Vibrio coralliirubri]
MRIIKVTKDKKKGLPKKSFYDMKDVMRNSINLSVLSSKGSYRLT